MYKTTDQESTYKVIEPPLMTKIYIVMREPLYDLLVLLLNSYRFYFYRKYSHLQVKRKLLNNTACIWFLSFDL